MREGAGKSMLIQNIRLIAELSDGIAAERGAVRVEDGLISKVSGQMLSAGCGETVIDGGGMTLLPGLIDAHTHLAGLRGYDSSQLRDPMRFFTRTCLTARRYLDYGFTTIRDCGAPLRVNNAVRDAIECGLFCGPRIISCGMILSPTEIPEDDPINDMYIWIDSPDESRKAARRELANQADFVKIMASGSALHKHGIPVQPILTEEEICAVVAAATLKESCVAAHAHGDGAISLCIEAGARTIEHASYIGSQTIKKAKEKGCWVIPTVSAMYQNPDTTGEEYRYLIDKLARMLETSSQCLRAAYMAGVRMGFGTDSCPGMEQYEHGLEFRLRHELCGMKNVDILMQATKNNAAALGLSDVTGEIREGLSADLVLVDGRPEEDISCMYRRPALVFMRGKNVSQRVS